MLIAQLEERLRGVGQLALEAAADLCPRTCPAPAAAREPRPRRSLLLHCAQLDDRRDGDDALKRQRLLDLWLAGRGSAQLASLRT